MYDISAGGFSIETRVPFPAGAAHAFEFVLPDGRQLTLKGTAVHSMQVNRAAGEHLYLIGFAFSRDHAIDRAAIDALLEHVHLEQPTREHVATQG
jgi:hypothetical protein